MNSLLLIAHGSRREASNQEVRELAKTLAQAVGDNFDLVVPSFLELAEPSISAGVSRCVGAGSTTIRAVPFFLSAGRHVAADIPNELQQARLQHPGVVIELCDYLGSHEAVPAILLSLALGGTSAELNPQGFGKK
ncbi:MAG: cobalamin biosynthesis protein CbiX [Gammaproteobacteria bacterium]|nr:cobalamin biosynthesis protein CbiX [Gammaproteobacteria bacterium]